MSALKGKVEPLPAAAGMSGKDASVSFFGRGWLVDGGPQIVWVIRTTSNDPYLHITLRYK